MNMKKCGSEVLCLVFLLFFVEVSGEGYQCCGAYRVDNQGKVFIETNRMLPSGVFSSVIYKACSLFPFSVQLWKCDPSGSSCSLDWQQQLTPSLPKQNIQPLNNPPTITSSHRIGFFVPLQFSQVLSIPFGIDSSLAYLSESENSFNSFGYVNVGSNLKMKTSIWKRSFGKSFVFCKETDCSDQKDSLAKEEPTSDNPLQPPKGECCSGSGMCDFNSSTKIININDQLILNLSQTILQLEETIRNLTKNNYLPAKCPENFFPGEYGLGKCYMVVREAISFSEAALFCKDSSESIVVKVESDLENRFLYRQILSTFNQNFWLGALYEDKKKAWSWYNSNSNEKTPIDYNNWASLTNPIPTSRDDVCSIFKVPANNTNNSNQRQEALWYKTLCSQKNFFICEIPKECD